MVVLLSLTEASQYSSENQRDFQNSAQELGIYAAKGAVGDFAPAIAMGVAVGLRGNGMLLSLALQ